MPNRIKICSICLKVKAFDDQWKDLNKEKIEKVGRFGVVFDKCPTCFSKLSNS